MVDINKHLDTHNWFNFQDFYTFVSQKNFKSFVEVGVWKGHSICFLGNLLKDKEVSIYAVDLWDKTYRYENTDKKNIVPFLYDIYLKNLELNNLTNKITNIKKISWEAANDFEDSSIDFVFIDADHEYDSVVKDINAWLPKIRKGGMISGHDYFNPCGVKQAVDEIFGDKVNFYNNKVWYLTV